MIKTGIITLFILMSKSATADSFTFLNMIYSPRLAALAGSGTADLGDVTGLFMNPAGVAYIDRHEVSLSYMNHMLEFKGGMIGYTCPMAGWGNMSIGIVYLDYGSFEEIDKYGIMTGQEYIARDVAMAVSYAYRIDGQLAFGMNLKYIHSSLGQYHAAALSSDLGILYSPSFIKGMSVGMALLNSGHNFQPYDKKTEHLPLNLKIGIAHRFVSFPFRLYTTARWDIVGNYEENLPLAFSAGCEYTLGNRFSIRLGYDHQKHHDLSYISGSGSSGFSCGFGIHLEHNCLDYAINDFGALGFVHRFGVTFHLKESKYIDKKTANEVKSLIPPQNVAMYTSQQNIFISWDKQDQAKYDVFVRNSNYEEWIKITPKSISQNSIELLKPTRKGTYFFAVKAIRKDTVSDYSVPVSISIY